MAHRRRGRRHLQLRLGLPVSVQCAAHHGTLPSGGRARDPQRILRLDLPCRSTLRAGAVLARSDPRGERHPGLHPRRGSVSEAARGSDGDHQRSARWSLLRDLCRGVPEHARAAVQENRVPDRSRAPHGLVAYRGRGRIRRRADQESRLRRGAPRAHRAADRLRVQGSRDGQRHADLCEGRWRSEFRLSRYLRAAQRLRLDQRLIAEAPAEPSARPISPERLLYGTATLVFSACGVLTLYFVRTMDGGMSMPGGWTMSMMWMRMPGQTWAAASTMFVAMWVAMMIAMMLP